MVKLALVWASFQPVSLVNVEQPNNSMVSRQAIRLDTIRVVLSTLDVPPRGI